MGLAIEKTVSGRSNPDDEGYQRYTYSEPPRTGNGAPNQQVISQNDATDREGGQAAQVPPGGEEKHA
jgi:hypothetical protein